MGPGIGISGLAGDPSGIALPPWLFPPEDADPVEIISEVPVNLSGTYGGDPPGEADVLTFDVPARMTLRVYSVGFNTADPTDPFTIEWLFRLDGDALRGYHYLPAVIGSLAQPSRVFMVVKPGRQLQVHARNNGRNSSYVTARISGWLYEREKGVA